MNGHRGLLRVLLVVLAIALVSSGISGCKTQPTPSRSDAENESGTPDATSSAETSTPPQVMFVNVYLTRGDKLAVATRQIPATKAIAAAAVDELLKGPSAEEKSYGLGTTVPEGTRLRSVAVANKVATVDLTGAFQSGGGSLSMTMRLTQVVYTLTQFKTITSVRFSLDGKPVSVFGGEGIMLEKPLTRLSYEDVLPAILVETPAPGQSATGAVRVLGSANVFEAVFVAEVRDSKGTTITKETVTATSGTGTRGTFDVTIPFTVAKTQEGSLVVYEPSAKDGSPVNVVTIPLKLEP